MFRTPLMVVLAVIGVLSAGAVSLIMFVNWYPQTFCTGNWAAMVFACLYVAFFILDMFAAPPIPHTTNHDLLMPFGWAQFGQVAIVIGVNIGFVIFTIIDTLLP